MAKQIEKEQAIILRKKGYSYKYIEGKVFVSKSTLSSWLADIPYTPNEETIRNIGRARAQSGKVKSDIKRESLKKANTLAKKDIGILTKRDLFMLGIGLYIGEGTKSHNLIRFINADPKVIKLAIKWFKDVCGLKNYNFSIRLHLYPDNNIEDSINFWMKETGFSRNQFQKTQIDLRKKNKSKRGKLPNGTAHITVKSNGNKNLGVFLFRRIQAWSDEVMRV